MASLGALVGQCKDGSAVQQVILSALRSCDLGVLDRESRTLVESNIHIVTSVKFEPLLARFSEKGGKYSDIESFIITLSLFIDKVLPPSIPVYLGDVGKIEDSVIRRKREEIGDMLTSYFGSRNPDTITEHDLMNTCSLYNKVFLGGKLPAVSFSVSSRMTSSMGTLKCKYSDTTDIEMLLSVSGKLILSSSYESGVTIGGLVVYDRVAALQLVLEHEIVHLLVASSPEYIRRDKENKDYSPHGKFFRQVMESFFKHSSCNHNVSTKLERNFTLGQKVSFHSKDKKENIEGCIVKINKKTVIVECEGDETALYRVCKSILDCPT